MFGACLVGGFAGRAFAPWTVVAVGHLVAGFLYVTVPFAGQHLEAADGHGFGEGHVMHRPFIGLATDFIIRGAHFERAGRQHHHFRAVFAVLEHGAGLGRRRGLGGRQQAGHQCRQGQGFEERRGERFIVHESSRGQEKRVSEGFVEQDQEAVDFIFGIEQAGCGAHHRADVAVHCVADHTVAHQVGGHLVTVLALDPKEAEAG